MDTKPDRAPERTVKNKETTPNNNHNNNKPKKRGKEKENKSWKFDLIDLSDLENGSQRKESHSESRNHMQNEETERREKRKKEKTFDELDNEQVSYKRETHGGQLGVFPPRTRKKSSHQRAGPLISYLVWSGQLALRSTPRRYLRPSAC